MKKQVVFCTEGIFPHSIGGIQRHSRLLIEALASMNKLDLIVVHPHPGIKVFNDFPGLTEIAVERKKFGRNYIREYWNYSKKVYEVILQYPDAIIYSQGLSVMYKISEIGHRVIVNPHGLEPYQTITLRDKLITTPFRIKHNYVFKHAAKIVSLGGRLTDILKDNLHISPDKIVVLPNATNVEEKPERNFDQLPLKFLFVGRFAFNKGIDILIKTIQQLNQEGYADKLQFNLVGKGPMYDYFTKNLHVPNINFFGSADDATLSQLYKTNDAFAFPTLFEGMPTVVLEAMSWGMPVIVTDVGATKTMVDRQNGFIIEKKNVISLKNAIKNYYQLSGEERKKLSDNSYMKVKNNFTWQIVAGLHYKLFESFSP